jgi:hypothetical protein
VLAVLVAVSTAVHVPEVAWKKAFDFTPSESHPHAGVEARDGGFLMVMICYVSFSRVLRSKLYMWPKICTG